MLSLRERERSIFVSLVFCLEQPSFLLRGGKASNLNNPGEHVPRKRQNCNTASKLYLKMQAQVLLHFGQNKWIKKHVLEDPTNRKSKFRCVQGPTLKRQNLFFYTEAFEVIVLVWPLNSDTFFLHLKSMFKETTYSTLTSPFKHNILSYIPMAEANKWETST